MDKSVTMAFEFSSNVIIPVGVVVVKFEDHRLVTLPSIALAGILSPWLPFAVTLEIDKPEGEVHSLPEFKIKSIIGRRNTAGSLAEVCPTAEKAEPSIRHEVAKLSENFFKFIISIFSEPFWFSFLFY